MNNPFVSAILVSYNSQNFIVECLTSLMKQSYKDFNIIFVDNNNSDYSLKIVEREFPEVIIMRNQTNFGFAKACNLGIEKAFKDEKVKYTVCLNTDMVLDENWLEELVIIAEKNLEIGSVQSKILLYDNPDKINTAANKLTFLGIGYCGNYLEDSSVKNKIEEIPYASGTSVLFSRQALEKTGFFDEDYFLYHEDVDLGLRLKLYGFKNLLAPKSVCYHRYSFQKDNKVYFLERNRLITIYKNFSTRTLFLISFAFIINEIGLNLFLLFTGNLISKFESYFYIINNFPKIHQKRKAIQNRRIINDKKISELLTSKIEFQEMNTSLLKKLGNPFFDIYWKIVKKLIK